MAFTPKYTGDMLAAAVLRLFIRRLRADPEKLIEGWFEVDEIACEMGCSPSTARKILADAWATKYDPGGGEPEHQRLRLMLVPRCGKRGDNPVMVMPTRVWLANLWLTRADPDVVCPP